MDSALLFIETSDIGAAHSAAAARALGLTPVFLCQMVNYQADTRDQLLRNKCIDGGTLRVEEMLDSIAANDIGPIAGVTTLLDSRLTMASYLAERLSVPGLPRYVHTLSDKAAVAALIPEFSPKTVSFAAGEVPAVASIAELFAHASSVIVKPTRGAGALGVFILERPEDVAGLACEVKRRSDSLGAAADLWIAQPLLPGRLISMEGYVTCGEVRVLGYSGRQKYGATESMNAFPVDDSLSPEVIERSKAAMCALVERAGFLSGYFHVEFIATGSGCCLIDANVGRPGGGPIIEQIAISFGIQPADVCAHVLRLALFPGVTDHSPYGSSRVRTTAVQYGLREGGILEDVVVPEGMECYHTQILGRGTVVPPMGRDNWSWVGILTGARDAALDAAARMRIRTQQGEFPVVY